MFTVTEEAKKEIQNRIDEMGTLDYVRLQMRHSCYMKLKLTVEDKMEPNDIEEKIEGIRFIINQDQVHYFKNKKIVYGPDKFEFYEFDAIAVD